MIVLHSSVIKTATDNHYDDNDDDVVHNCKVLVSSFYWTKILPNSQEQLLEQIHLGNYFQV